MRCSAPGRECVRSEFDGWSANFGPTVITQDAVTTSSVGPTTLDAPRGCVCHWPMPKVVKGRTKFHDRAPTLQPEEPVIEPEPEIDAGEEGEAPSGPRLTRGQVRRNAARERYLRKFDFVSYAKKQDEIHRNGALDLSSIASELDKVGASSKVATPSVGGRTRPVGRKAQRLANEREMAQFQAVIDFEPFKKDPFAAIEQHVANGLVRQQAADAASKKRKPAASSAKQ